jgi:hypothetical protein
MTVSTLVNPTLRALVETLLWSSTDDSGQPLDLNYTASDFDEKSLEVLYASYQEFVSEAERRITEKLGDNWDSIDDFYDVVFPAEYQTEHDFILTLNGHGCGFDDGDWSSSVSDILTELARNTKSIETYVGDDNRIYVL